MDKNSSCTKFVSDFNNTLVQNCSWLKHLRRRGPDGMLLYVLNKTRSPFPLQYDAGFENSGSQFGNATQQRLMGASKLLDQKLNPKDPDFINCIYGVENSPIRYVEQCLASFGCCEAACCKNRSWQEKYVWAVTLLAIFCAFVIFFLFVTLFCWFYNRSRDKRQKRFINESMDGMSPAISQVNLAAIENRMESGYYPYVGGPNQY